MVLAPLPRRRASDDVYAALRDGILGKLFRPGQRLQMNEIASELGVSLTPVRQALQRLASEGLIEIRPRSGTFVATVHAVEIEETCKVRLALELLAAEEAVERLDDGTIAEFHRLLDQLRKPVRTEAARKSHENANSRFHRLLISASGNRKLGEIYNGLNLNLQIARLHARDADWGKRLDAEQREHEAIVRALEKRDLDKLQQALRTHIERARVSLIQGLEVYTPAHG